MPAALPAFTARRSRRHDRARCSSARWRSPRSTSRDPSQPVPARVAALLSQMTLAEKVAQLAAFNGGAPAGEAGSASVGKHTIAGRNAMQANAMNASRFGIPLAWFQEALHGGCAGATVFPMPLTMGASLNVTLVERMYAVIGRATRACGANIAFAPVINLWTDPRFGRFQEGFSPEPTLSAHYGVAAVAGLQGGTDGNASTYLPSANATVVALGKHLAGYGGAMGGLNGGPLVAGEREIRDVYLKPWRAFAAAGGRGAMPSHQTVLDVPAHASSWLINDVFRDEYGFGDGLDDLRLQRRQRFDAVPRRRQREPRSPPRASPPASTRTCSVATRRTRVRASRRRSRRDCSTKRPSTRRRATCSLPRWRRASSKCRSPMRASRPTPLTPRPTARSRTPPPSRGSCCSRMRRRRCLSARRRRRSWPCSASSAPRSMRRAARRWDRTRRTTGRSASTRCAPPRKERRAWKGRVHLRCRPRPRCQRD